MTGAVFLLCCMGLLALAQPATLQQDLLAYFPMKTDLQDHSSRKQWVAVIGTVELKDEAAHFAGNGSWLELPHLPFDGPAFAVSMWINPESAHSVYGLVEQREVSSRNRHLHLMLRDASQPYLGFGGNDAISPIGIGSPGWTHLVFQFTGTHQQIWINGQLICERAAKPYVGVKGLTRLGRSPRWTGSAGWDYQGLMREVRIYGRALSFSEVVSLHDAPAAATSINRPPAKEALVPTSGDVSVPQAPPGVVPGAVPFLSIEKDHLTINGSSGQIYLLQASTNLTVPWQPLALLTNLTGRLDFTDVDAGKFEERFYRIRVEAGGADGPGRGSGSF